MQHQLFGGRLVVAPDLDRHQHGVVQASRTSSGAAVSAASSGVIDDARYFPGHDAAEALHELTAAR
jgi:hypothetical protein